MGPGAAPQRAAQPRAGAGLSAPAAVERTVAGLGYDLVEVERAPRGLLRVMIDRIPGHSYPEARGAGEFVTIDDCEVVTRQLQLALEVEAVAYERLEVSSPGLDRPLRRPADFERFVGQEIELALKEPFQGRRHWRGVLARRGEAWALELLPSAPAKAKAGGKAGSKSAGKPAGKSAMAPAAGPAAGAAGDAPAADAAAQELGFELGEVREARLVPVIDFKGRARGPG